MGDLNEYRRLAGLPEEQEIPKLAPPSAPLPPPAVLRIKPMAIDPYREMAGLPTFQQQLEALPSDLNPDDPLYGLARAVAASEDPAGELTRINAANYIAQTFNLDPEHTYANLGEVSKYWLGRVEPAPVLAKSIKQAWDNGMQNYEIAKLAARWRDTGGTDQAIAQQLEEMEAKMKPLADIPRPWVQKALLWATESSPLMLQSFLRGGALGGATGATAGLMLGGITAAPTLGISVPALTLAMASVGFAVGSTKDIIDVSRGLAYWRMRKANVPHNVAGPLADIEGIIEGSIESLGSVILGIKIPGLTPMLKSGAQMISNKLLMTGVVGTVATRLAGQIIVGGLGEGIENPLQELTAIVTDQYARYLTEQQGLHPEIAALDIPEAAKRIGESFYQGISAGLVFGVMGVPGGVKADVGRLTQIRNLAQVMGKEKFIDTVMSGTEGQVLEGTDVSPEAWKKYLGKVWDTQQKKFETTMNKAVAEGKITVAKITPAANVYRRADGSIFTMNREVTHTPEGDRTTVVAGNPETGERYASAVIEKVGDSLEIIGLTTAEGREDVVADFVKKVAQDNPTSNIIWNPTDEQQDAVKAMLVENNPRGPEFGLQWYSPTSEGGIEITVTRENWKQTYGMAFGLNEVESESLVRLSDLMAKRLGVTTNRFLSERFTEKIAVRQTVEEFKAQVVQTYPAGEEAAAQVGEGMRAATQLYDEKGQLITDPIQASQADLAGRVKAVVHAFQTADFTSAAHEFFHVVERHGLDPQQTAALEALVEKPRIQWTANDMEKLAYTFEKYLEEGVAPTPESGSVFATIANLFRQFAASLRRQQNLSETERRAFNTMFARLEGGKEAEAQVRANPTMSEEELSRILGREVHEPGSGYTFAIPEDTILAQVKPPFMGKALTTFLSGLSPQARETYDLLSGVVKLGELTPGRNAFAFFRQHEEWNAIVKQQPEAILTLTSTSRLAHVVGDQIGDPEVMANFKPWGPKDVDRSAYLLSIRPKLVERFTAYLKGKTEENTVLVELFDQTREEMARVAASAREAATRIPEDLRKAMHLQEDGTIRPSKLERSFKMERSIIQRILDAMPLETWEGPVTIFGKPYQLSDSGTVTSIGGEAYRRAILEEVRRQYKAGTLTKTSVAALGSDGWGAMGFLGANEKTLASGDFTTLCPQIFFNRGCWYCYRRAALEEGANNKLVGEKVWYTGEILRLEDKWIQELNRRGGLRVQSFGDWMPQFSAQFADMLADADQVGLQVKVITKEPSMVEFVSRLKGQGLGTSLYFNISTDHGMELVGPAEDPATAEWLQSNPNRPHVLHEGKIYWKRALSIEEGNELRKKYPWVNIRTVATSVREFIADLKDSRVDVVTGYHGHKRRAEGILNEYGEADAEVDALGDNGMPRFGEDGSIEYVGKTEAHRKLAEAIQAGGLQREYLIKACCVHGRCVSCTGVCGLENRSDNFWLKNETNRDIQSKVFASRQRAILAQVDALHGTAYEFEKFELDKMGTGEGAQAFGWGMYFTTEDRVATHYAEMIARKAKSGKLEVAGETIPEHVAQSMRTMQYLRTLEGTASNLQYKNLRDELRADVEEWDRRLDPQLKLNNSVRTEAERIQGQMELAAMRWVLERLDKGGDVRRVGGRVMYSVTMLKDNFISWYEPLSDDQRVKIEDYLEHSDVGTVLKTSDRKYLQSRLRNSVREGTGEQVYENLSLLFKTPRNASLFLQRVGIDGIRYPTGTLVAPGKAKTDFSKGTNYVVFDAENIKINQKILFQVAPPVTSMEFQQWFWKSKIIDEFGRPKVLYHWSPATDIEIFRRGDLGMHFGDQEQAENIGAWSQSARGKFYKVYLRMENPLRLIDRGGWDWLTLKDQLADENIVPEGKLGDYAEERDKIIQAVKDAGYDGIVYLNRREGIAHLEKEPLSWLIDASDEEFSEAFPDARDSYMVFDPEQIKSVENTGSWSLEDPRILFQTAAVEQFRQEIEGSVYDYMSEQEMTDWEGWGTNSDHKALNRFMESVSQNPDYQEALQTNLKRMGFSEEVVIYKGKRKGVKAIQGKWGNASLAESTASRFRRAYAVVKEEWDVHPFQISRKNILALGNTEEAEVLFRVEDAEPLPVMPALFQTDPEPGERSALQDLLEEAKKFDNIEAFLAAIEKEQGPEENKEAARRFYERVWTIAQTPLEVATAGVPIAIPEIPEEATYDYLEKVAIASELDDDVQADLIQKGEITEQGIENLGREATDEEESVRQEAVREEEEAGRLFDQLKPDEQTAIELSDQLEAALTDFEVQQKRIDELVAAGREVGLPQTQRASGLQTKVKSLTLRLTRALEKSAALSVRLAEMKTKAAELLKSKESETKWRIAWAVNEQREIDAFRAGLTELASEKKLAKTQEQRDMWRAKTAEAYLSKREALAALRLRQKWIDAKKKAALRLRTLRKKLIKDILRPLSRGVAYKFYGEQIEQLRIGLNKEQLKEMTIGSLEYIDQQIDVMRKAGRAVRAAELAAERNMRSQQIAIGAATVLRGVSPRRPVGTPAKTPVLLRALLPTLKPDRVALWLDGGKPGFYTYWLQDRVNNAWGAMQNMIAGRIDTVARTMEENKLTTDQLDPRILTKGFTWIGKTLDLPGFTMDNGKVPTFNDAMYWYIGMNNERTRRAILEGNRIPEEQVLKGISQLTEAHKTLANAIRADFDANFSRLRDAFIRAFNMDLPAELFYVPMRRLEVSHETRSDELAHDLVGRRGLQKEFVARNPTYARKDIPDLYQMPIRTDLVQLWQEGVKTQEGFINQDLLIKQLHGIMESREVSGAILQKHGSAVNRWMSKYLNDLAQSDAYAVKSGFERMSRQLRGHLAVAYLGFNLLSASKQLVSSFGYVAEAGPLRMAVAAAKFAAGQGHNLEGQIRPFSNKLVEWAKSKSDLIRNRSISPVFEELARLTKTPMENITRKVASVSMKLLQVIDIDSLVIGWTAVYDKVLAETGIEDVAIAAADRATIRTQPSGRVQDLAEVYRSGDALKWFTMFTSELNTIWNRMFDITQVGKSGLYARAVGDLISIAMAGLFIAVAGGALNEDDPEKRKRKLLLGLFSEFADSIPFIGSDLWAISTGQYRGTGVELFPATQYFGKMVKGMKEGDLEKTLSALIETTALTVGLPYIGPKRAIKAIGKGRAEELLGWKE